nr:uncharacterized protein LOC109154171 [Ipomoea batatas]
METMDHLFCSCPAVAQIWHEVTISHHDTLVMLVTGVLNSPNVKETIQVVATLWLLWNARNDVVWKEITLGLLSRLFVAGWQRFETVDQRIEFYRTYATTVGLDVRNNTMRKTREGGSGY